MRLGLLLHQRGVHQQFLSGGDAQLGIDVPVVEFERALLDTLHIQNFLYGPPGNVVFEDLLFHGGEGLQIGTEQLIDVRIGIVLFCTEGPSSKVSATYLSDLRLGTTSIAMHSRAAIIRRIRTPPKNM